jgi:hypothetical protein
VTRLLAKILAGSPRLPDAACINHPELFDPLDPSHPNRPAIEASAIDVCRRCPALADCSAWVTTLPARQRPAGVVAGQVTPPRKILRGAGT